MANKTDLDERRVVTTEMGEKFAKSKGLTYFECSAVRVKFLSPLFSPKCMYGMRSLW